jgi:galactose-1-phosphate uridylyltransferase
MDTLKPSLMRDAFQVCQVYFQRMAQIDRDLQYASINWNYMPPSGGGLLHPHLQTIISDKPTRFVQTLYTSARRYEARTGCRLWEELVATEKAAEERYIGATGSVQWLTSFAPRGMAGELAFFLPECRSLLEITDDAWGDILDGLARVLAFLDAVNLLSFNLALYGTLREDRHLCVQGRIIPRILILPLGASDVNYFDKLHGETICPVTPEQICSDIRPWFGKR